jgi:ubiquinol-cytochrome c reductase cytochrome b subunit
LNRFFALHVVAVPIIILALVVLHLLALHEVGSNNPDGVEIKKNKDKNGVPLDGVAFHPYYTVHDIVSIVVFLMVFCSVIFFFPEMGGYFLEYANFEQANSLKTPAHIAPVWYFTPFYSILRAVPDKLLGFIAFGSSVAILFVLPWLDRSPVKSIRYKGKFSIVALILFTASFLILGVLGVKAPTPERTLLAQICSIIYFAYFITMPFWSAWEKTKPVPDRVTMNGGFGMKGTLLGFIIIALLTVLPLKAVGSEAMFECGSVPCEEFKPALDDNAALQRGAKNYLNYCAGCHSMQYMRYERLATDLDIPLELAQKNFIFDDSKIGDLIASPVPAPMLKKWFGATPPDLTLAARARGSEWLYTYLKSFYVDPKRPYGVNNLVFKDVGMPNVLANVQGDQVCRPAFAVAPNGGIKRDPLTNENIEDEHSECGRVVHIEGTGTLKPEEFNQFVSDLVSFMTYAAEPVRLHDRTFLGMQLNKREVIGVYCLLFLSVFLVFALLLNREYWKDVH